MSKKNTLSTAQIKMLQHTADGVNGKALMNADLAASHNRAMKLVSIGLLEMNGRSDDSSLYSIAITPLGLAALGSLTVQPAAEDMPVEMEAETLGDEIHTVKVSQTERDAMILKIGLSSFAADPCDTFSNAVISDLCDRGLAKRVMVSNTRHAFFALTWAGQDELKALAAQPEPTGPALTPPQQDALNTFDERYDYMSMTPRRYMGIVRSQYEVVSYIKCDDLSQSLRFTTVNAVGDAKVGSVVEFELSHPFPTDSQWWVKNVRAIDPRDAEIASLKAEVAALKAQSARREAILSKHYEFVRDMCGYSFSDRDDARYVSDCVDELEGK